MSPAPGAGAVMEPVLRRMSAWRAPSPELVARIGALGARAETVKAGAVLRHDEDARSRPLLVVSGWASQERLLADGRRQIFALLLPGDGLGMPPRSRGIAEGASLALTALTIVDARPLLAASGDRASRELAEVLEFAADLERARLFDQLMRLGRQSAYERMAHLFCELHDRLAAIGRASETEFEMPLTQETLADLLGLSVVHVNRTLQQLRRDGLVEMRAGMVFLARPGVLRAVAEYRPPDLSGA